MLNWRCVSHLRNASAHAKLRITLLPALMPCCNGVFQRVFQRVFSVCSACIDVGRFEPSNRLRTVLEPLPNGPLLNCDRKSARK